MTDPVDILKKPTSAQIRIWYPWTHIDVEMEVEAIERLRILIEEGSDTAVFCGHMTNGQRIMLTKLHEVFGYSIQDPKSPDELKPGDSLKAILDYQF